MLHRAIKPSEKSLLHQTTPKMCIMITLASIETEQSRSRHFDHSDAVRLTDQSYRFHTSRIELVASNYHKNDHYEHIYVYNNGAEKVSKLRSLKAVCPNLSMWLFRQLFSRFKIDEFYCIKTVFIVFIALNYARNIHFDHPSNHSVRAEHEVFPRKLECCAPNWYALER